MRHWFKSLRCRIFGHDLQHEIVGQDHVSGRTTTHKEWRCCRCDWVRVSATPSVDAMYDAIQKARALNAQEPNCVGPVDRVTPDAPPLEHGDMYDYLMDRAYAQAAKRDARGKFTPGHKPIAQRGAGGRFVKREDGE